jgi:hypothetical protein
MRVMVGLIMICWNGVFYQRDEKGEEIQVRCLSPHSKFNFFRLFLRTSRNVQKYPWT